MTASGTPISAPSLAAGRISADAAPQAEFLNKIFAGYAPRDFAVRLWDGSRIQPEAGHTARFTLAFNHPGAVRQAFWPRNKSAFGEAYIYGDIDIEGDADALFQLLYYVSQR